jgi:hypothetical protein
MNEIFVPIEGYSKYQISNLGRIKSTVGKEKILKTWINKGYYSVSLMKDKVQKNHLIHRLVAQAFIPNPENKPEVNHIDGDTKNFNISNLEWSTHSENIHHSKNISKNGSVISRQKILEIYNANQYKTVNNFLDIILANCK